MRKSLFCLFIVILCLLQISFAPRIKIFNVKPDFILAAVIITNIFFEFKWAFVLSVFLGVFKDVFGAGAFGINILLFWLWSYLVMWVKKEVTLDNNIARLILMFIVALMHNIITGMILIYLGKSVPLGVLLKIIILGSAYTTFAGFLILKLTKPSYY